MDNTILFLDMINGKGLIMDLIAISVLISAARINQLHIESSFVMNTQNSLILVCSIIEAFSVQMMDCLW